MWANLGIIITPCESYFSVAAVKEIADTTSTECVHWLLHTSKAVLRLDCMFCVCLYFMRSWMWVNSAYGPSQSDFPYVMSLLDWAVWTLRTAWKPRCSRVGLPVCYVYASLDYCGSEHCVQRESPSWTSRASQDQLREGRKAAVPGLFYTGCYCCW